MTLVANLAILTLAGFVGFAVISKVPNTLHTPLMSGTNAIHGIVLDASGAVVATATASIVKMARPLTICSRLRANHQSYRIQPTWMRSR